MPSSTMPPSPKHITSLGERTRELVLSAKAGSTRAFHRLADLHQDAVFRMVYHRVHSRMDAEDLTQDIFLKAFRHLNKLKTPERFRSWLFSIALNRVRDFIRQQKLRRLFGLAAVDTDEPETDPEDPAAPDGLSRVERQEFWETVETIMHTMSTMEREVFTLRFIDQLGIASIARVLKKAESTVKTHLYRAIAKFKSHPASMGLEGRMP
jgi:RNA polymerase sigma-70 factor (ECF subfamily)